MAVTSASPPAWHALLNKHTDLRIRLTGAAEGRLLGAQLLGRRHAEVA